MSRPTGNKCLAASFLLAAGLLVWLRPGGTDEAFAAQLTLKIRVINPSPTNKQTSAVTAVLPKPAKPEDVVNAGDLEIVYSASSNAYLVQKQIELEPGQTRTFDVVLKDVWVIPEDTLKAIDAHAKELAVELKGTGKEETAVRLGGLIDESLKSIGERQASHAVGTVKPIDHIRAFEINQEMLLRARRDLGLLENLAVAAGKSPKQLMGTSQAAPPREVEPGSATGNVVVLRIKVTNPSPTEKKKDPLRRDLPFEIKPTDVLDAGGLQIGFDGGRNVCYAFADAVELAPGETKAFDVKVRNPWADALLQAPRLERRATELIALTAARPEFKTVQEQAQAVLKDLAGIKEQKAPATVNEQYVAFARNQAEALRSIESRVMRLEELFQPREKPIRFGGPMMEVPRPDRRTTWVIIYIILGFLAAFSVFFFFRWFGRTKAEKLDRKTERENREGTAPSQ
jgi:hypothetical protein